MLSNYTIGNTEIASEQYQASVNEQGHYNNCRNIIKRSESTYYHQCPVFMHVNLDESIHWSQLSNKLAQTHDLCTFKYKFQ